jgi:hypothetical protein
MTEIDKEEVRAIIREELSSVLMALLNHWTVAPNLTGSEASKETLQQINAELEQRAKAKK